MQTSLLTVSPVLSLPTVNGSVGGGQSLHYDVSISLAVVLLSGLSFVVQKLFSHPSVLQEELLYK